MVKQKITHQVLNKTTYFTLKISGLIALKVPEMVLLPAALKIFIVYDPAIMLASQWVTLSVPPEHL